MGGVSLWGLSLREHLAYGEISLWGVWLYGGLALWRVGLQGDVGFIGA